MDPLQQAHALAQSGDLEGSARLCRAVLSRSPAHGYALFLLGSIEAELGQIDAAARHLKDAVAANPRSPDALTSYGKVLLEQKRYSEGADALTRALSHKRDAPLALVLRGQCFAQMGREKDALKDFDRALDLDPRSVLALQNRAHLLIAMKRYRDAHVSLDAALTLAPENAPLLLDRIALLVAEEKYEAALPEIERALARTPDDAGLWNSRGLALMRLNRFAEARAAFEHAAACDPKNAMAALNIANSLMEEERLDDALAAAERAVATDPAYAPAHVLRGNILLHLTRYPESLESYDTAVAVAPDYPDAHYHRGSARLLAGDFTGGFADFEYRWQASDCGFERPVLKAREWQGEPLQGKTLIVYSEQGLGDTIQFARFLPELAARGSRLTFLCHPGLIRLFQSLTRGIEVVAQCDAECSFDYQCALMSLPRLLGAEPAHFADSVPYLKPEPERIAHWRSHIGTHGFKIGIGWQGNPIGRIDRGRSVPLSQFALLAAIPNVRLISLQKRHGLEQLSHLPQGMAVETFEDFDEGKDAFIDTAAMLESLDLVVTSDSALPHLAGALGRPCWMVVKKVPDWRWMLDRNGSPWYPTLTLYRQKTAGDWHEPFHRIVQDVREMGRR